MRSRCPVQQYGKWWLELGFMTALRAWLCQTNRSRVVRWCSQFVKNCMLIDGENLLRLAAGWRPAIANGGRANEAEQIVDLGMAARPENSELIATLSQVDDNPRVSVVLAQEEACELNSDEIRPEHLLVGVLQSAG